MEKSGKTPLLVMPHMHISARAAAALESFTIGGVDGGEVIITHEACGFTEDFVYPETVLDILRWVAGHAC